METKEKQRWMIGADYNLGFWVWKAGSQDFYISVLNIFRWSEGGSCSLIDSPSLQFESQWVWSLFFQPEGERVWGKHSYFFIISVHNPLAITTHLAIPICSRGWEMHPLARMSPLGMETRTHILVGTHYFWTLGHLFMQSRVLLGPLAHSQVPLNSKVWQWGLRDTLV